MINKLWFIRGEGNNPYHNLALEAVLLNRLQPGECYLYLWQNKHTVVLGRNQNILAECHVQQLQQDGGHVSRRLSGGGAVYHDLGNLNFTMIMATKDFDIQRQDAVILQAMSLLGLQAEVTGRNDLTIAGRKFSGHAYYHNGGRSYHHGTIMVNVDTENMVKYLNVSPLKLQAKGVQSVRSRVGNLVDFKPGITVAQVEEALQRAFGMTYKRNVGKLMLSQADLALWQQEEQKMQSEAWLYGEEKILDFSRECRFNWGTIRLDYTLSQDKQSLAEMQLWSDGLEAEFLQQVPAALKGCAFDHDKMLARLSMADGAKPRIAEDIISMLMPQEAAC